MVIDNLTKKYNKKVVLNNISFEFTNGIYGILGPNGAGKTTLMKCIIGLESYEGKVLNISQDDIGYLPQKFSLFKQLTVKEALLYISLLKNADEKRIDDILNMVNLYEEKNTKIKNLSGGMVRRLGIAQAIVGNPKIIIVDEPTVGLDPKERIRFRNLLTRIADDRIVLISSHIVEDIESIADKIIVINEGQFLISGIKEDILAEMNGKVGECWVEDRDVHLFSNYQITNSYHKGSKTLLHIVGDQLPECEKLEPTLEDAYFYFTGDEDDK